MSFAVFFRLLGFCLVMLLFLDWIKVVYPVIKRSIRDKKVYP